MTFETNRRKTGPRTFEYLLRVDLPPSIELTYAISEIEGIKPDEVDPSRWTIDLDALDSLTAERSGDVTVEFTTHGYRVQLDGSKRILLQEIAR